MRLGRTSLRTGLQASGRRRRKLRTDLVASPQVVAGETSYVIKMPDTGDYHRYGEMYWKALKVFDGTRTDREAWEELSRTAPELSLSLREVEDLADSADPDVWERTLEERNLALLEKVRGERKERAGRQSAFYLSFSAWNPDRFFDLTIPYVRWVWSRACLSACLAIFAVGTVLFARDFDRIMRDTGRFYTFSDKSLAEFADFWILLLVVSFIHECAHGLTCKNFGGEVRHMGFMLVYFTPAFYTDVSDMYLFDKDYKRLWTIFAGVWIETVMCSLSLLVWTLTAAGTWVSEWAYKLMLMTSITGVLFNLNPLMKFDGYYALGQMLKIDNLREDSFDYLKQWARHYLSGGREPVERASRRKHRIFLVFGPLALAYSALVIVFFLVFVKNVATSRLGLWGWPLAAAFAWLILRRRLAAVGSAFGEGGRRFREGLMGWKDSRRLQAGAGVAALVVLVAPTPVKVTSDFVLEPGSRAEVRAATGGLLEEVAVLDEQPVETGALLAVLRNPDVEARAAILERRLNLAEQAFRAAQAAGDPARAQLQARERQRLWAEWQEARRKRSQLRLRAPFRGVVATPLVAQRSGEYLREGQALCTVVDRRVMRARVLVRDDELEEIEQGRPVNLKVNAHPLETFAGRVERVLPAAATDRPVARPERIEREGQELFNYFAVTLEFPNAEGRLREGMTGTAKLYGPRRSLAGRAARSLWRWARSQVWL